MAAVSQQSYFESSFSATASSSFDATLAEAGISFETPAILGGFVIVLILTYVTAQIIFYAGVSNNKIKDYKVEKEVTLKTISPSNTSESHASNLDKGDSNKRAKFIDIPLSDEIISSKAFTFDSYQENCNNLYLFGDISTTSMNCNSSHSNSKNNEKNDASPNDSAPTMHKLCLSTLDVSTFPDFSPIRSSRIALQKYIVHFGGMVPIESSNVNSSSNSSSKKRKPKAEKSRSSRNKNFIKTGLKTKQSKHTGSESDVESNFFDENNGYGSNNSNFAFDGKSKNKSISKNKMVITDKLIVFDTEVNEWFIMDNSYFVDGLYPSARCDAKFYSISENSILMVGGRTEVDISNYGSKSNSNSGFQDDDTESEEGDISDQLFDAWILHLETNVSTSEIKFRWESMRSYPNHSSGASVTSFCLDREKHLHSIHASSSLSSATKNDSDFVLESVSNAFDDDKKIAVDILPIRGDRIVFRKDNCYLRNLMDGMFVYISSELDSDSNFNSIYLLQKIENSRTDYGSSTSSSNNCSTVPYMDCKKIDLDWCGDKACHPGLLVDLSVSCLYGYGDLGIVLYICGVMKRDVYTTKNGDYDTCTGLVKLLKVDLSEYVAANDVVFDVKSNIPVSDKATRDTDANYLDARKTGETEIEVNDTSIENKNKNKIMALNICRIIGQKVTEKTRVRDGREKG